MNSTETLYRSLQGVNKTTSADGALRIYNEEREETRRLEKVRRCDHCGLSINEGTTCDDCLKANARDIATAQYNQSEYGLPIPADIRKLIEEQEATQAKFEQGCDEAVEEFLARL